MMTGIVIGPVVLVYVSKHEDWILVCWLVDIIFLADILFNFFIVKERLDTKNPKVIALAYLTSTFWMDLLVTLPMLALFEPRELQVIRLCRIFWRYENLWFPIDHALSFCVKNNYRRQGYIGIAQTFFLILLMCHFYVCFWLFLGDKYLLNDESDPWLVAN